MNDRIDKLGAIYVKQDWFDTMITAYAFKDRVADLEKKVAKKAD